MQKVDTTVKNYTVQIPAYLWEFLNQRAQELNFMTSTYLNSLVFREMQNPSTFRDMFYALIQERLYPYSNGENAEHLIDLIYNESEEIYALMPDENESDTLQQ